MKVLIVDDSVVIRSAIRAALDGDARIELVGSASNGKIAIEMVQQKNVDLMILDLEMPVLGGIETLKALRALGSRVKVIVFSSLTTRGSEMTLEALAQGAQDFVTKPKSESLEQANTLMRAELLPKVLQFLGAEKTNQTAVQTVSARLHVLRKEISTFLPRAVVIASSTGGPAALERIFEGLHGKLKVPVLLTQHMPPVFTNSFAKRIQSISGLNAKEAAHGDFVEPSVYVAPGDFHMTFKNESERVRVQLDKGPQRCGVRPSADNMFESAVRIWGPSLLGIVLTGMGEDGLAGSRALKECGGGLVIQDRESCVVFGMPGAVFQEKLQDSVCDLAQIRSLLKRVAIV